MTPERLEEIEQAWGINQSSPGLKQHPSYVERQSQVEELIAAARFWENKYMNLRDGVAELLEREDR